jgi:hypothetical protein
MEMFHLVTASLYDINLTLYVQSWTPDDGRKDRPKHVEWYSINSKICTSGWFYCRNSVHGLIYCCVLFIYSVIYTLWCFRHKFHHLLKAIIDLNQLMSGVHSVCMFDTGKVRSACWLFIHLRLFSQQLYPLHYYHLEWWFRAVLTSDTKLTYISIEVLKLITQWIPVPTFFLTCQSFLTTLCTLYVTSTSNTFQTSNLPWLISFLTGAQDSHLQTVTIPEAAYIRLRRRLPEDEQGNARNM